jgi:hypothetical protein
MKTTNQIPPQQNPLFYFLTEQSSPEHVCESLEALLYGYLYYASESGIKTNELLRHYETAKTLLGLFHQLENTQLQEA